MLDHNNSTFLSGKTIYRYGINGIIEEGMKTDCVEDVKDIAGLNEK